MPTIRISKGKLQNPTSQKLYIVGPDEIEVNLDQVAIVTTKRSFCIVEVAEYYVAHTEIYGTVDDFIKLLSSGYIRVDIDTPKGRILGAEINRNFLKQLTMCIKGLIAINMVREGKFDFKT